MPLETVSYISDLVITNPDGADQRSTADDHLRNIKKAITQTFPAVAGLVSVSHTELNRLDGISANIETRLDAHLASISAINTTISGITTTLAAYGASISAINTTISAMTTTQTNYAASLSELSVNVVRANPSGTNQKIFHACYSASASNVNAEWAPTGWSASVTYTSGRTKLYITNNGDFDVSNSMIILAANYMLSSGASVYDLGTSGGVSLHSSSTIVLDTSLSGITSFRFMLACLRK